MHYTIFFSITILYNSLQCKKKTYFIEIFCKKTHETIIVVDIMCITVYTVNMVTMMIRDMDADLRRRFKIICTENDISMNRQAKKLIREFVEKKEAERKQGRLAM